MAGIYIHIPFCSTRCNYCDFFSTTNIQEKSVFIKALVQEITQRKHYITEPVETIYFGGGTPSLLSQNDLESILNNLYKNFSFNESPEITLEANPDDLTTKKIKELKSLNFNRLSIGIQSFNDSELQFMSRRHNAQQAITAVKECQNIGFENISIDLIFGLPNQNISILNDSLEKALSLNIQHISSYNLTYEEGTKLHSDLIKRKITALPDNKSIDLFEHLINTLSNHGFEQYEISNYCKPGFVSLHNSNYWKNKPYLGLGPSAHSYNLISRQWNISSLHDYIELIHSGKKACEEEILSEAQKFNEYIMTSLRTKWGFNMEYAQRVFNNSYIQDFLESIKKHIINNNIVYKNDSYILTRKGMFISDTVFSDLFVDEK